MLTWIIQIFLLSLIFIFLLHHLFCYMKDTLTIPKVKDLVTYSSKKYDNIYSVLSNKNVKTDNEVSTSSSNYTEIDLLPNNADSLMKDELKNFLKKNLNKSEEYTEASSDLYSENYTYL